MLIDGSYVHLALDPDRVGTVRIELNHNDKPQSLFTLDPRLVVRCLVGSSAPEMS